MSYLIRLLLSFNILTNCKTSNSEWVRMNATDRTKEAKKYLPTINNTQIANVIHCFPFNDKHNNNNQKKKNNNNMTLMKIKVPLRQLTPLLLFCKRKVSNLLFLQFGKNKNYMIIVCRYIWKTKRQKKIIIDRFRAVKRHTTNISKKGFSR